MREVKFRAWDNTNKEWLLGYDYKNLGGFSMFGECVLMGEWGAVAHSHIKGNIDLKLMQYTGLKDKNGVDIYEGDIVREYPDDIGYYVRVIEYKGHGFVLSNLASFLQHEVDWNKQIEVIGNIHENPDLLEAK